jgi:hypothetical protein
MGHSPPSITSRGAMVTPAAAENRNCCLKSKTPHELFIITDGTNPIIGTSHASKRAIYLPTLLSLVTCLLSFPNESFSLPHLVIGRPPTCVPTRQWPCRSNRCCSRILPLFSPWRAWWIRLSTSKIAPPSWQRREGRAHACASWSVDKQNRSVLT